MNDATHWQMTIHNRGHYSFAYKWKLSADLGSKKSKSTKDKVFNIAPSEGVVDPYNRATGELVFAPSRPRVHNEALLSLQVRNAVLDMSVNRGAGQLIVSFNLGPLDCKWTCHPHQVEWGLL